MSNERQRQAPTLVVVARDNLKTDRNKRLPFAIKKKKKKRYLVVDHAARTQCLELSPNGPMKKWN